MYRVVQDRFLKPRKVQFVYLKTLLETFKERYRYHPETTGHSYVLYILEVYKSRLFNSLVYEAYTFLVLLVAAYYTYVFTSSWKILVAPHPTNAQRYRPLEQSVEPQLGSALALYCRR
ncbi:hypothetical protein MYVALT_G_00881 [Candidatus Vallotia tarda]|uniref:Uncharacterized protein n=1 Tax=Candidatus Vallotiella hemipterorum TaxID=1177213 RepID=A0A916NKS8_9BURK|nr:hypothetical protein MYVALT_G_00881 [Candidatus Vallotia tarda]